jgi:hypothetical protein
MNLNFNFSIGRQQYENVDRTVHKTVVLRYKFWVEHSFEILLRQYLNNRKDLSFLKKTYLRKMLGLRQNLKRKIYRNILRF